MSNFNFIRIRNAYSALKNNAQCQNYPASCEKSPIRSPNCSGTFNSNNKLLEAAENPFNDNRVGIKQKHKFS